MTLSSRGISNFFPVLLAFALAGCPQDTEVWIAAGSSADAVMLSFGRTRERAEDVAIGDVTVAACSDSAQSRLGATLWRVTSPSGARLLHQARYGETPGGFRIETGPTRLAPGCYIALISGTGRTRFRVMQDGRVVDEGRPW